MIYTTDKVGLDERGLKLLLFESMDSEHLKACSYYMLYFDLDAMDLRFDCNMPFSTISMIGHACLGVHLMLLLLSFGFEDGVKFEEKYGPNGK